MDLWIRSQDKEILLNVKVVRVNGITITTYDIGLNFITIGKYATKQRALEVLDDIQIHIESIHRLNIEDCSIIYEMPKE